MIQYLILEIISLRGDVHEDGKPEKVLDNVERIIKLRQRTKRHRHQNTNTKPNASPNSYCFSTSAS